ncbi:MAG: glycosyltransferase family 9 protein, partial [Candidatus Woesearchaeota archaeon]
MYEIIKFVDKNILNIIIYLFPRRNNKPKKIQNILFIKLWALGDSVNTLPLIKAVKNKYNT